MPPRRAIRPTGPAIPAVFNPSDDEDRIQLCDVIEALGNLRTKSEAEYVEWRRLEAMNYIGAAKAAKADWVSTNKKIDRHITLYELLAFDQLLAAADNT